MVDADASAAAAAGDATPLLLFHALARGESVEYSGGGRWQQTGSLWSPVEGEERRVAQLLPADPEAEATVFDQVLKQQRTWGRHATTQKTQWISCSRNPLAAAYHAVQRPHQLRGEAGRVVAIDVRKLPEEQRASLVDLSWTGAAGWERPDVQAESAEDRCQAQAFATCFKEVLVEGPIPGDAIVFELPMEDFVHCQGRSTSLFDFIEAQAESAVKAVAERMRPELVYIEEGDNGALAHCLPWCQLSQTGPHLGQREWSDAPSEATVCGRCLASPLLSRSDLEGDQARDIASAEEFFFTARGLRVHSTRNCWGLRHSLGELEPPSSSRPEGKSFCRLCWHVDVGCQPPVDWEDAAEEEDEEEDEEDSASASSAQAVNYFYTFGGECYHSKRNCCGLKKARRPPLSAPQPPEGKRPCSHCCSAASLGGEGGSPSSTDAAGLEESFTSTEPEAVYFYTPAGDCFHLQRGCSKLKLAWERDRVTRGHSQPPGRRPCKTCAAGRE